MSTFSVQGASATAAVSPPAALPLLCAAQFLLVLDVTVVNVAVPSMSAELGLSAGEAQAAVTAYAVPFGALLLAGARAGDRFSRRAVLVVGLLLFALGSALSAAADGTAILLLGRVLQGVAAAAVSPSALGLLVTVFPSGPAHRRALAAWGAVGASGAAAGVVLGGVLTSAFGWRSVFLAGVPAAVLLALAALRALPAAVPSAPRRLDGTAAVLMATAAGSALLVAARVPQDGATSPVILGTSALAVLALVALAARLRRSLDPLVAPELLGRRSVATGAALMALGAGTLVTAFYLTSVLLQQGHGHSPVQTGLTFLPGALATVVGAHAGGHAVGRWGTRPVALVAMALAASGAGVLSTATSSAAGTGRILSGFTLLALGLGAAFVVAATTTMADLRPGEAGMLAGVSTTAHELGAGLVLAVVVALTAGSAGALHVDDLSSAYVALVVTAAAAAAAALVGLRRGDGVGTPARMGH